MPFGEFVHLHMQYCSFANSILKCAAFPFLTSARKPTVNFYSGKNSFVESFPSEAELSLPSLLLPSELVSEEVSLSDEVSFLY